MAMAETSSPCQHLPKARHFSRSFRSLLSLNPPINATCRVLLLSSYYDSNFTGVETKAQMCEVICPKHYSQ